MKKKKITFSDAWREARDLIYSNRYRLALGLLLMVFNRVLGLVLPASSKYLIDEIIVKRREELLVPLAFAAGAATMLQAVSSFALSQVLGVAAQRAITEMRKRVMRQVTRLPLRFFDSTQSGKLISRVMNDAEGVRNLVGSGLVQLFGGMVTAAIALVVLFYLNWKLTSLTMLVLGLFAAGMGYSFKKLRPLFRQRGEIYSEVTGRLGESLGGIRVVKAYTAEKRETLAFARGAHRLFRNIAKSVTGVSAAMTLSTVVIGAIGIVIIIVGGRAILAGEMTLGDFVMYIFFTGLVAAPMVEIAGIGTQITEAFAGLDRIREIMNTTREDEDDDERESLGKIKGDITFENVSFEYNEGEPVLKNVSLYAPAGTTTALVGSSGSGKSTLISLVMSFNYPKQGRVLLDGRDLQRIRLRDYRSQIGVVLQDNFLFDGTIADNISFSNPEATREQIIAVSRIANCEEFINGFEKGYDTIVGERGVKLSGGQRQRIAIARAILADPKILILDEATSSLDSESEALIQEGLKHLRKGRTTFVIAHRLSTIQSADQILVLENGEIVERGTHRELLALNGRYRQLYDKQYRFERDLFLNPGEETAAELPVSEMTQNAESRQGVLEL